MQEVKQACWAMLIESSPRTGFPSVSSVFKLMSSHITGGLLGSPFTYVNMFAD